MITKNIKIILVNTSNSNLYIKNNKIYRNINKPKKDDTPIHLYFISNDDIIKEGDYYYHLSINNKPLISKADKNFICNYYIPELKNRWIKIIASTDMSNGLPFPSYEFIDEYVNKYNKGIIIEYVKVQYKGNKLLISNFNNINIKSIIDKFDEIELIKCINSPYYFFKNYCQINGNQINTNITEEEFNNFIYLNEYKGVL